jgi:hypothetical protein
MKSTKILNLLIAGIALIGGILFIRIFMEDTVAIETDAAIQNSVISPLIYFSTWLLIATVVVAVGLSLLSLFRNPENLKKTLKGTIIIVNKDYADTDENDIIVGEMVIGRM